MVGRRGHPRRGAPRAGTRGTRSPRQLSAGRAERGLCAKATFAARRSLVIAERAGGPVPPQAPLLGACCSSPRRKVGRSAACMPAVCVLAAVSRRRRCRAPLRLRRRAVCICARSRSGALGVRSFPRARCGCPAPRAPCAWTDLRGVPARSSSRWATPRGHARKLLKQAHGGHSGPLAHPLSFHLSRSLPHPPALLPPWLLSPMLLHRRAPCART